MNFCNAVICSRVGMKNVTPGMWQTQRLPPRCPYKDDVLPSYREYGQQTAA